MDERTTIPRQELTELFSELNEKDQQVVIFLYEWGRPIRVGDIRNYLDYPHSTLNSVVERLQDQNIVEWKAYKQVRLLQIGKDMAAHQLDHHSIIHLYLVEHLDLTDSRAHEESIKVAGIFSCKTVEKMRSKISDPELSKCKLIVD